MNLIHFWSKLAQSYDEEGRCGFCWSFGAPLSQSQINVTKLTPENQCCVHLLLTSYTTSQGYEKSYQGGFINKTWCDHSFTLYVVQVGKIGLNVYNEIPDHPIEEGLWESLYRPLQECLGCGNELDLCALGYDFEILQWRMELVKYKEGMNWTGWKIVGTFRNYNTT